MKLILKLLSRYPLFGLVLFYGILTIPQLNKGLSSLDGHGTVASINRILDGEGYQPSRPPGHPSTEIALYLPIAYGVKNLWDKDFNWETYNYLQWFGGLASIVSFYLLLKGVCASSSIIIIGTLTLLTSNLFLGNAMDGSEFNWGLAFLFCSFRLMVLSFRTKNKSLTKSIVFSSALLAVATGFRQEFIFVFLVYPILFHLHPALKPKDLIRWIPIALVFGIIVWLPVLIQNSFSLPMPMPMPQTDALTEFRNRMLGGGYKLLFLGLTVPVSIVLLGWMVRIIESHQKLMRSDREICFVYISACLLTATYIGFYFTYPYKPDFILIVIPLLILLSASLQWKKELYCLSVATLVSLVVQIDIFEERNLTHPHIESSLYWQKIKEKPHHKRELLQREIGLVQGKKKVLLLTNLWSSDFNYLLEKKILDLIWAELPVEWHSSSFSIYQHPQLKMDLLVASRRAIEAMPNLQKYQENGYEICISEKFLRSFFFKYEIRFPISEKIKIGTINFTVI